MARCVYFLRACSPTSGAPYSYVATKHFLSTFGFETFRNLPNIEALEDAGLLHRKGASEKPYEFADDEVEK